MLEKLKIDRKLLKELDFSLIIVLLIIVLFGILNIYSASQSFLGGGTRYLKTQLLWLLLSLITVYVILLIDYSTIMSYANVIYWSGIILLVLNDTIFKKTVNGAASWMSIGGHTIGQPSEFAKLGMIIIIAKKLNDMEGNINNVKNFCILSFYALLPMFLIVKQPDMGMTMVCFFIVLGMFFVAGLDLRVLCAGLFGIVGFIAAVWNTKLMKEYWKSRLTSFLHPEKDELGAGLQLIKSKNTIGSGGIWGTGYLKGFMTSTGQVPESNTDMIFSAVGEEWGFVGGCFLLVMYGILIFKLIKIARKSKDIFGTALCAGVVSSILFSVYQNIGMSVGMAPISGLTLPFMSYGGSSMVTYFISVGLVLNVGMRRKKINF